MKVASMPLRGHANLQEFGARLKSQGRLDCRVSPWPGISDPNAGFSRRSPTRRASRRSVPITGMAAMTMPPVFSVRTQQRGAGPERHLVAPGGRSSRTVLNLKLDQRPGLDPLEPSAILVAFASCRCQIGQAGTTSTCPEYKFQVGKQSPTIKGPKVPPRNKP